MSIVKNKNIDCVFVKVAEGIVSHTFFYFRVISRANLRVILLYLNVTNSSQITID